MKEIILEILKNNPNIFSAVFLPVLLILITTWQSLRIKKLENKLVLDKEDQSKEIEVKFNSRKEIREQERIVHTSLVRILFDIQKLHISLSTNCDDKNCVEDGLKKFNESFESNQNLISANLLCLPSRITNHIYKFYKQLAGLIIELQGYKNADNYELAIVSVYLYSRRLADEIINVQNYIINERRKEEKVDIDFQKVEAEMMRYCCGEAPPKELREKYEKLKGISIEKLILDEQNYMNKYNFIEQEELPIAEISPQLNLMPRPQKVRINK